MEVQLFNLILITITTTITNFACGELFLQMPLTINPVVQEIITKRGSIVQLFSSLDPEFYSRLSPVDMVTRLDYSLSHVMRKTISGAVVLGVAAKSDGLTTEQLLYNSHNKWTVNVSLIDIRSILTTDEVGLFPFSDNITLSKLQSLGMRVLQQKYNVSLEIYAEKLHSSNATTFQTIEKDWIEVVKYITASKVNALATKYDVNVEALAKALNLTSSDLYNITLIQLDTILLKEFNFVGTTPVASTMSATTTRNPTTAMFSNTPTIQKKSSTLPETLATSLPTVTNVGSQSTGKLFSTKPSLNLVSSAADKPTEGKSEGTATINLALFVGVAVGLLLLLVASSSVWCFRRKRRHSLQNEKTKNNKDIKMNNIWLDKTDNSTPSSPEVRQSAELYKFVRSSSTSTLGVDSRFKELRYNTSRPSSSTFTECSTTKVPISRNSFLYDHRKEIFV